MDLKLRESQANKKYHHEQVLMLKIILGRL